MQSVTFISWLILIFIVVSLNAEAKEKAPVTKLQIGVKKRPDNCDKKSKKGDTLHVHYTVSIKLIVVVNFGSCVNCINVFTYLIFCT